MMQLSLMCDFFRTVDAMWHSPVADSIARAWPQLDERPVVWRASANFVCGVEAGANNYVLRFNHEHERDGAGIAAELAFVHHAAQHGVPVAQPVALPNGEDVARVETPLGVFYAVLFEALSGKHDEVGELDDAAWGEWGAALGRLHAASAGCPPLPRPSWREHLSCARQYLPHEQASAWRELQYIEQQLAGLAQDRAAYGLVHFDFERDNLKRDGERLAALDFDDCAYYWFEADIAFALRDLFHDSPAGIDYTDAHLLRFVAGYRSQYPLADAALPRLPLFLRLHNLYMHARLVRALGAGPSADEPPWAAGLRGKLAAMNATYLRDCAQHPLAPARC